MPDATAEVLVERVMVLLICDTYKDLSFARDHVRTFGDSEGQQAMQSIEVKIPEGGKWRLSADMRGNTPPNPTLVLEGIDLPDTMLTGMAGADIDAYVATEILKDSGTIVRSATRRDTGKAMRLVIDLEPCMMTRPSAVALIEEIARRKGEPLDCIKLIQWLNTDSDDKHAATEIRTLHSWL